MTAATTAAAVPHRRPGVSEVEFLATNAPLSESVDDHGRLLYLAPALGLRPLTAGPS